MKRPKCEKCDKRVYVEGQTLCKHHQFQKGWGEYMRQVYAQPHQPNNVKAAEENAPSASYKRSRCGSTEMDNGFVRGVKL